MGRSLLGRGGSSSSLVSTQTRRVVSPALMPRPQQVELRQGEQPAQAQRWQAGTMAGPRCAPSRACLPRSGHWHRMLEVWQAAGGNQDASLLTSGHISARAVESEPVRPTHSDSVKAFSSKSLHLTCLVDGVSTEAPDTRPGQLWSPSPAGALGSRLPSAPYGSSHPPGPDPILCRMDLRDFCKWKADLHPTRTLVCPKGNR